MVTYYSYCKVKGIGIRKLTNDNPIIQNIFQIIFQWKAVEYRKISV